MLSYADVAGWGLCVRVASSPGALLPIEAIGMKCENDMGRRTAHAQRASTKNPRARDPAR